MNRSQLIGKIAKDTGMSAPIVELMMDSLQEMLAQGLEQGEKIVLPNFGRFELQGSKRETASSRRHTPAFVPSSELKKRVAVHQK